SSVAGEEALASQLDAVQREVRAVDSRLPILTLETMSMFLEESMALWLVRAGARIFMLFGGVALLLSIIGVYGLRAYSVAQRTRELGIRIALGASRGQALWLVLSEGLRLTALGCFVGFLLAVALARALSSLLYEVEALDPLIFLLAPTVLIAASVFACLVPARRASRIDPLVALKYE
ncbi:MAG TPA: FtsX-like permease family protein, partial [Vicinamibacteria bacterium]|nr:FtsX-like permease family protein [Vicinamibacteria bacterium]